jgi:hypothetical protein
MSLVKTSAKAGQLVNTQHVDMLLSNYKKERWVHNSKRMGKVDSLSVWYGMDELQDFMQAAEQHGADGIRMYFGVYPEQFNKMPQAGSRQTIVLVATKNRADANGNIVSKHIYRQTEEGMQLLAFNVGLPCPPCCGNSTGDDGEGSGLPYPIEMGVGLTLIDDEDGLKVM